MKKIFLMIIVLILLGLGIFYGFVKKNNILIIPKGNEKISEDRIVSKDGFDILLPRGWREIQPMANGVSMSAWDEKVSDDEGAKKINYHANYNVTYGKLEEQTKDEYLKMMKEQIKTLAPNVNFSNEKSDSFEAELKQQNVDFKALISVISGKGGDVWSLSFNSPKNEYNQYKPVFDEIIGSFLIK